MRSTTTGRPLIMLFGEGQMSIYNGAALTLNALLNAKALLGDGCNDANWFRRALLVNSAAPFIPSKISRKGPIRHDRRLYRQCHKINDMFAKLEDWRRFDTGDDQCLQTLMSTVCSAATVIVWLTP